ncbi:hypothetical protein V7O61_11830 [Methanolobus sp. WCC1]|uniref:hypothetical protein n=1 Tax=unclassified Methanolobus TaxID=2629569 RepID=UPI003252E482
MKRGYKIILGLILIIVISAVLASQWSEQKGQEPYDEHFSSDYYYAFSFTTSDILNNFTVYIPFLGPETQYSFGNTIKEQEFGNTDPSWEYDLVETEYGLMLSISNEKVDPQVMLDYENQANVIRGEQGEHEDFRYTFYVGMSANHIVNTSNPIGNEPLLTPMYNISQIYNEEVWSNTAKTYQYDSRIFAEYSTDNSTNVTISLSGGGSNSWSPEGEDVDDINYYGVRIESQLSGPQDGWIITNGRLITGEGTYREENK